MAVLLLFTFFAADFWLAFEQGGTSLNLLAAELTDRGVGSYELLATGFQSVGALLIILPAPALAAMWSSLDRRGMNPAQPVKIALALFLLGGGDSLIVAGSIGTDVGHRASMFWLVATNALRSGEGPPVVTREALRA